MLTRKQKWRKCPSQFLLNKYKNTEKLLSESNKSREKIYEENSIKFSNLVKVILIPSRMEYENVNLDKQLWYKDDDYIRFKNDYFQEVRKSKYNTL